MAHREIVVPGKTTQGTRDARISGAQLAERLGKLDPKGRIIGVVLDGETRESLFDARSGQAAVPASTTKIVTSTAALTALDPAARITTKVVRKGDRLVLVGGGDPTLSSRERPEDYPGPASVAELAKKTADALKAGGTNGVTVDYDASLYSGSVLGPGWKPTYVTEGSVAPISALMVDNGRVAPNPCEGTLPAVQDGPKRATQVFVNWLNRYGVQASVGRPGSGEGGRPVADVQSPTVSALVEHLMDCSDNEAAEALARQVALKKGRPASFDGAARAIRDVLQSLGAAQGVETQDGSGLSPLNRITPLGLAKMLSTNVSGDRKALRTVITGMPVAGFSGTLSERFLGTQGAGVVRAKTGTLNHVATLAGVIQHKSGRLLTFAFMANGAADLNAARSTLDAMATAAATCDC
ncbi:D-alanyl-D-alanine carboxypeptidase/D-alanyl-D-alanine endopeptidase [Actinocorallia populi]|uniref:D-alanyl-D-alanine carboxypeptidase/D-alanyl-D-alanine endopeptidase n=1 Tax=Actinocorallia populi TaxID=2079200 RepID=UPI001E37D363|nr:D-alanyl-D-alanine carboxypeptidase/D-alanyl-D-alanine-endopeptidase [Actinocorallia populi]